jgi:hypothetical protein
VRLGYRRQTANEGRDAKRLSVSGKIGCDDRWIGGELPAPRLENRLPIRAFPEVSRAMQRLISCGPHRRRFFRLLVPTSAYFHNVALKEEVEESPDDRNRGQISLRVSVHA